MVLRRKLHVGYEYIKAFAVLHVIRVMVLPSSKEEPCLLEGYVHKLTNDMSSVLHMERIMTNYASHLQMEQIQFVIKILFDLLCYIDRYILNDTYLHAYKCVWLLKLHK